jgi:exopolyphosphatase/guanosine-5'-triphosphate,3'-diphosphate pyrophosphatase
MRTLAAIDIGSNSTHLLIVEVGSDGSFRVLESAKEQTRLAADLDDRLMFDAQALNKMVVVLKKMRDMASRYQAQIRCVATHALREARNGSEFANRLSRRLAMPIDIVSGQEEARLVSLGVRFGLPLSSQPTLIVDVGGGSTEIVVCQRDEVLFATSLKLGAVRLTQKFLKSDPFSDGDLRALEGYVLSRLEPVCHEIKRLGFESAVGSSGTIKSLQSLSMASHSAELPKSLHGTQLSLGDLLEVYQTLCRNKSVQERRMLANMDAKRADIIVAGAVVLKILGELCGVRSYQISETALREGIVVDTLAREFSWLRGESGDVRWQNVRAYGARMHLDEPHAWHITNLTMSLFDSMEFRPSLGGSWRELLRCAAYLHECGKFINLSGFHKHGDYLIRNSAMMGFSRKELDAIGALVRFHRKRTPRADDDCFENMDPHDILNIKKLSSLLRLAVSLDRGRLGRIRGVKLSTVRAGQAVLTVSIAEHSDAGIELYELNCEKGPFETAFDVKLEVRRGDSAEIR